MLAVQQPQIVETTAVVVVVHMDEAVIVFVAEVMFVLHVAVQDDHFPVFENPEMDGYFVPDEGYTVQLVLFVAPVAEVVTLVVVVPQFFQLLVQLVHQPSILEYTLLLFHEDVQKLVGRTVLPVS